MSLKDLDIEKKNKMHFKSIYLIISDIDHELSGIMIIELLKSQINKYKELYANLGQKRPTLAKKDYYQ